MGILFLIQKAHTFPLIDYVEYWSAGRINLLGGNPYSLEEMYTIEKRLGWTYPDVLMMWNPPWILAIMMPFSSLEYYLSRTVWFLLQLTMILYSANLVKRIYKHLPNQLWIAWAVVLSFGPILHTIKIGQITPIILLGYTGFLYFLQQNKPFLAGVTASVILLKPHLLYLLLIAILLWSIKTKNWKLLAGFTVGVIFPLAIACLPNSHLISQYIYATKNYPPMDWQTATWGALLRNLFGHEILLLQFVPSILGTIWFLIYWLKNHKTWNWLATLPVIIVGSIATSAYGWTHDVSALTFVIVIVWLSINFQKWTIKSTIIFLSYWGVNMLSILISKNQLWFWWLSSFFAIWYIFANQWIIKHQLRLGLERK